MEELKNILKAKPGQYLLLVPKKEFLVIPGNSSTLVKVKACPKRITYSIYKLNDTTSTTARGIEVIFLMIDGKKTKNDNRMIETNCGYDRWFDKFIISEAEATAMLL